MNHYLARIEADPSSSLIKNLINLQEEFCSMGAGLFCQLLMTREAIKLSARDFALLTQFKYFLKCPEQLAITYPTNATVLFVSSLISNHDCRLGIFSQIAPNHVCDFPPAKPSLVQSWAETAEKSYFCSGVNSMQ